MDKRYYSEKHRRNNRRRAYTANYDRAPRREKGTFLLRLNICLGVAIIAVGIYRLNNDFSAEMTDRVTAVLSESTSAQSVKNTAVSVFKFISEGKHTGFIANLGNDVTLSQDSLDYIAQNENFYYNRQKSLESP